MNNNNNKIVNETVDALIATYSMFIRCQVEEQLKDRMYEYGNYNNLSCESPSSFSNDELFAHDQEYFTKKVMLELYNRLYPPPRYYYV